MGANNGADHGNTVRLPRRNAECAARTWLNRSVTAILRSSTMSASPTPPESQPDHAKLVEQIAHEEARLWEIDAARAEQQARIERLRAQVNELAETKPLRLELPALDGAKSPATAVAKVALFRSLFRGRGDVYPRLWVSSRSGKKGYSPVCGNDRVQGVCEKPRVKCGRCPNQAFLPVTDQVILDHLQGKHVVGVYPLLEDDTCWFLAVDFDKEAWRDDVAAFVSTCEESGVQASVERSRSGNGAHVWFFFESLVPATLARKLGSSLLTRTMERRHQLGMASYDRLFPNQDTLPRGGFGNLIALPLQRGPRDLNNTVFLDDTFEPYKDQWAFLASVRRLGREEIERLVAEAARKGRILGVHLPASTEDAAIENKGADAPWQRPQPHSRNPSEAIEGVPPEIRAVLAQRLFIEKEGLPSALLHRIGLLASFQNPEFYKKQSLRLSTALTPRVISCVEDLPKHLAVPRGCRDEVDQLLRRCKSRLAVTDEREGGAPIDVVFRGDLTPLQNEAVEAVLSHEIGVVVAPPGFGKTVLGASLIAKRARSVLVLVHRKPLLDQWVAQLASLLEMEPKNIGHIGGGKRSVTGEIDVAMIQSLGSGGEVDELVSKYGHVVVDECHHVPAVSFERVLAAVRARYLLGLTATPDRRDGHHPILAMQLGPVRFEVSARGEATACPFARRLIVRETGFRWQPVETPASIQEIYRALATDPNRNQLLIDDVISAVDAGRSPIVLTERKDHLHLLADELKRAVRHVVVLRGGMGTKARRKVEAELASIPPTEERLLLATGRYIGEGFDDRRLDTLFLAMPISWKGTLVQYAGRLHRLHSGKTEVRIYDYVDREVPMLARMFERRLRGYRALGYSAQGDQR